MATVSNDERDNRPRLIYKPYAGKKGPEFEPWVVGFLDAAEGKGDDDAEPPNHGTDLVTCDPFTPQMGGY